MWIFTECGKTFQTSFGTFSPPIVSENSHDNYLGCEWRIQATHGEKIILNITKIDTEKSPDCIKAYIEIRDGYWHKSPLLGRFCGSGQYLNLISTGSRMLVTYTTRNPRGHKGFMANFEGKSRLTIILRIIKLRNFTINSIIKFKRG